MRLLKEQSLVSIVKRVNKRNVLVLLRLIDSVFSTV